MKKESQIFPHYPIFLNMQGRRCVVVGGGEVASRKVRTLLEHGAKVRVVSPKLCPELRELAGSKTIHAIERDYEDGDLRRVTMAVAATDDPQINQKVATEARRRGVLINVVDDLDNSDFIVPSYLRRGDVTIAISTGGKSPALARKIRTKLETDFGSEYGSLAVLIDEVRSELKRRKVTVDGDVWQRALDLESLLVLLRSGRDGEAKIRLLRGLGIPIQAR